MEQEFLWQISILRSCATAKRSKDGFCFSYFLAFFHYGLDKGRQDIHYSFHKHFLELEGQYSV